MQQLTLYSATQIPHLLRTQLAVVLQMPENKIRVIAPEVGGGFGAKLNVYAEEALMSWVAMQLGRPVKYIETRSECFQAMIHGRDQIDDLEVAAKKDGTITALRLKITANLGAYHQLLTPVIPTLTLLMAHGCYRFENIDARSGRRVHQHDVDRRVPRRGPPRGDVLHRARDRHGRAQARPRSRAKCAARTSSRTRRSRTRPRPG